MKESIKYHGVQSLAVMYSKAYSVSKKVAEEQIRQVVAILEEGICDTQFNGIQFINSITLKRVTRKAKIGRNPKSREEVSIPERQGVKVVLGKKFNNRLNNK